MLIIDDLFLLLLENIMEEANREHLRSLNDHLRRIALMYERGQLSLSDFEEGRDQVLGALSNIQSLEARRGSRRRIDFGF